MGHLMRGIALAQGLRCSGIEPVFITRGTQEEAVDRLRGAADHVEVFPADWSIGQDLEFTRQQVRHLGAGIVVTDIGNSEFTAQMHKYEEYLQGLKQSGTFLVAIDDCNDLWYASDVVINPSYGAEELPYRSPNGTQYLLGPRYSLLRREFIEVAGRPREVRRQANRVAVTLGGSDLGGLAGNVLQALSGVDVDPPLEVRLGLGLEAYRRTEVAEAIDRFGGRCELFDVGSNIAEVLLWSDVAVTGGGLTKYETALTSTPSLILSQADHQHNLMEKFSLARTSRYLGRGTQVSEAHIRDAVRGLLVDHETRLAMSNAGRTLVDGRGVERVLEALQESCGALR